MYSEVKGDLIKLASEFDVIAHGCNCKNMMGAGLAPKMAKAFGCDKFELESGEHDGDINKLGCIDYEMVTQEGLVAVNLYSQYNPGANLDYEALTLGLRKMNSVFKGKKVALPQIGCGIAGGSWSVVKTIIQKEMADCDVTVVIFP